MIFLINKNILDPKMFYYFIQFQSESAVLPSCFRVQPHQSAVPRSQQQQARLLAWGDRGDDQPDGAGRLMQWNCPSPSTNWRLVQLEVTASPEEPSSGGKWVIEIMFCYLIGISLVSPLYSVTRLSGIIISRIKTGVDWLTLSDGIIRPRYQLFR